MGVQDKERTRNLSGDKSLKPSQIGSASAGVTAKNTYARMGRISQRKLVQDLYVV